MTDIIIFIRTIAQFTSEVTSLTLVSVRVSNQSVVGLKRLFTSTIWQKLVSVTRNVHHPFNEHRTWTQMLTKAIVY